MIIKKNIYVFLFVAYLTLILGFYLDEDSIGGARSDYFALLHVASKFKENFLFTLLNYDELGHRHSPIFFIIKSFTLNFSENTQKLIFLHIYLLIPFFFYKCLNLVFANTNKNFLKLISCVILFFPTYRSYSIWPDAHLLGTLFFIISLYFYLKSKFENKNNIFKNSIYNTFFLALSAYISPNFGVFVLFFVYKFFKMYSMSLNFLVIIFFNLILSFPFFYYLFYLDANFIYNPGVWDIGKNFISLNNFSNKIILVTSLIFFFLLPFFLSRNLKLNLLNISNYKYETLIYFFIFFISIYFFDFSYSYNLTNSGGGIIYNLSNKLISNNIFLFLLSFLTFCFLVQIFIISKDNLILFLVLVLSNPQITLWQANFSPTIYFLILLLFNFNLKNELIKIETIYYNYIYFLFYLVSSITYKLFII